MLKPSTCLVKLLSLFRLHPSWNEKALALEGWFAGSQFKPMSKKGLG